MYVGAYVCTPSRGKVGVSCNPVGRGMYLCICIEFANDNDKETVRREAIREIGRLRTPFPPPIQVQSIDGRTLVTSCKGPHSWTPELPLPRGRLCLSRNACILRRQGHPNDAYAIDLLCNVSDLSTWKPTFPVAVSAAYPERRVVRVCRVTITSLPCRGRMASICVS